MATFEISALWLYPVKSLGGVSVPEVLITGTGSLKWDREWLVVDAKNRMLWQGDLPIMTLLRVGLHDDDLTIRSPNGTMLRVQLDHDGSSMTVTQYGNSFEGVDAGDEPAVWLTGVLGRPSRLVRIGAGAHLWPKLNPVHLVSEHSLRRLNERLAAIGSMAIEHQRFRPNVLVAGEHAPFEEERTPVMEFGESRMILREPCIRCELPNISRVDASRQRQPVKLVATMALERPTSKRASFGTYAAAEGVRLTLGMASIDRR